MKRTSTNSNPLPNRRRLLLLEAAQKRREYQVPLSQPFDPVAFIERGLGKLVREFDWHYDEEDPYFKKNPTAQAFVDFTAGTLLVARESVMEQAYRGDPQSRFILAHEIAHAVLHKKSAGILARHKLLSAGQYSYRKDLELEANCYGGALLAPPAALSPLMSLFEIRRRFNVSGEVAEWGKKDAELWRKQNKK